MQLYAILLCLTLPPSPYFGETHLAHNSLCLLMRPSYFLGIMGIRTYAHRRMLEHTSSCETAYKAGVVQHIIAVQFQGHIAACRLGRQPLQFNIERWRQVRVTDAHTYRMAHHLKITTA